MMCPVCAALAAFTRWQRRKTFTLGGPAKRLPHGDLPPRPGERESWFPRRAQRDSGWRRVEFVSDSWRQPERRRRWIE